MPEPSATHLTPQDALHAWVAACLADEVRLPGIDLPRQAAAEAGVLPWLGWRLHESGRLAALPAEQQDNLRASLRRWGLMHLDCEAELERLAQSAAERGLRFIVFKGHSVARTLYPSPACRPTSDFDLLIDPAQVALAQDWIEELGYTRSDPFVGTVWLGQQAWWFIHDGNRRFAADLHWDYSNRMYFRKRVPFEALWAASREVACGGATLRVPCPVDDLILACVHLAAFDPGMHVRLNWLLDVYLLMSALAESDIASMLQRAGQARAIEACLEYGERAAELGAAEKVQPVLAALRESASGRRWRGYQRTLRWRGWDLACYWGRLPLADKVGFFGDMVRWIRVR